MMVTQAVVTHHHHHHLVTHHHHHHHYHKKKKVGIKHAFNVYDESKVNFKRSECYMYIIILENHSNGFHIYDLYEF
jgi:hypothetical protein